MRKVSQHCLRSEPGDFDAGTSGVCYSLSWPTVSLWVSEAVSKQPCDMTSKKKKKRVCITIIKQVYWIVCADFLNYKKCSLSRDCVCLCMCINLRRYCVPFLFLFFFLLFIYLFIFATPCSLWDLSALTRDWTWASAMESKILTTRPSGNSQDCTSHVLCLFACSLINFSWSIVAL